MKFRFDLLLRLVATQLDTFFDLCKSLFPFLFFIKGSKVASSSKICRYTVSTEIHIYRDICVQRTRQSRKNTLLGATSLPGTFPGVAHA